MALRFAGFGNITSLTYNGIPLFGRNAGANTIAVSEEPVQTDDGSGVVGYMLNITVEGFLVKTQGGQGVESGNPSAANNQSLSQMRRKLLENGKVLELDIGYGTPIKMAGADFTPQCRITNWKPLADGGRSAMFGWQCSIMTGVSTTTSASQAILIRKHFTVAYAYTENGTETRTVTGYVELSGEGKEQLNTTQLQTDKILKIGYLTGYHRRSNYVYSNNRRRLDFTIVDQQIETPHPYPKGFEYIEATQSTSWRKGSGKATTATQLFSELNVSMKRFPKTSPAEAYAVFKKIVESRYQSSGPAVAHVVPGGGKVDNTPANWMLMSLDAEEQLFGYSSTFSASFKCFKPISSFLTASNMWQPLDFGGWADWSRDRNTNANYWINGFYGKYWNPSEDILLDVESRDSDPNSNTVVISGDKLEEPSRATTGGSTPGPTAPPTTASGSSKSSKVDPEASFSRYDVYTYVLEEAPVGVYGLQAGFDNQVPYDFNPYQATVPRVSANINLSVVHSGGPPVYYVGLGGTIERVDHQIPMPELQIFGGQQCTRIKKFTKRSTIGSMGGHPISKLEFFALYAVAGQPNYEQIFNPAGALQTQLRKSTEGFHITP